MDAKCTVFSLLISKALTLLCSKVLSISVAAIGTAGILHKVRSPFPGQLEGPSYSTRGDLHLL